MLALKHLFERGLWHSRLIVLVAVVASLLMAVAVTWFTTVDAVLLLGPVRQYAQLGADAAARSQVRIDLLGAVVGIVDGYLLAAVLVVFALGLYGLFIGTWRALEQSEVAARLLHVRSVDDLKEKIGRVVILILIVKFAQLALELKYTTSLDVLALAAGILLVGAGFYLTGRHKPADLSHPA